MDLASSRPSLVSKLILSSSSIAQAGRPPLLPTTSLFFFISTEPSTLFFTHPLNLVRVRDLIMRQAGTYSGLVSKTGNHSLPLARIKKIMKKSGDDVKMISGEAPIVFSKACELFIEELTRRSWMMTMRAGKQRRTLHREDVASAVIATDIFDFLLNLVSDSEPEDQDCNARN